MTYIDFVQEIIDFFKNPTDDVPTGVKIITLCLLLLDVSGVFYIIYLHGGF